MKFVKQHRLLLLPLVGLRIPTTFEGPRIVFCNSVEAVKTAIMIHHQRQWLTDSHYTYLLQALQLVGA